jgi:NAD(P)-dependent dehydrogenase (short-subunit alcohol dehydrogenase family)
MSISADLRGKVALVTGASGGLGSHFARLLAANGAAVGLAARRLDRLEALAAEIAGAGGAAAPVRLDVTDDASVGEAFATVEAALGTVDVLVNNSGIAGRGALMADFPPGEFAAVLDVNLTGAYRVAREAAKRLVTAGKPGGSVVNVASVLAERVGSGVGAYAASKAGLAHLTRAMALEWARHGVRVNALAPGYILTEINAAFFASEAGKAMVRRIPQRRLGEPADLDGPLLLLASDASRYMTGSVLVVDGGHLQSAL